MRRGNCDRVSQQLDASAPGVCASLSKPLRSGYRQQHWRNRTITRSAEVFKVSVVVLIRLYPTRRGRQAGAGKGQVTGNEQRGPHS